MAVYDHVTKANRRWFKEGDEVPENIDPSAYPPEDEGGTIDPTVLTTRCIELETT